MQFREIIAVYCENRMKHTSTLFEQNVQFQYVKSRGTNSKRWALQGSIFPCHSHKLRRTEKGGWLFEEMCHCSTSMFAWLL
jgi:hypothetical protein